MSTYTPKNFKPGDILKAEDLNMMEERIAYNSAPMIIFDWVNTTIDPFHTPSINSDENIIERNLLAFRLFKQDPERPLIIGVLDSGRKRVGYMSVIYAYLSGEELRGRALNCDGSLSTFMINEDGFVEYFYKINETDSDNNEPI